MKFNFKILIIFHLLLLRAHSQNITEGYFPLEYANPDLGPCIALNTLLDSNQNLIHIYKTAEGFKVTISDSNFYITHEKHYKPSTIKIIDLFMVSFNSNHEVIVAGTAEGNKILIIKLSIVGDIIWAKSFYNQFSFDLNAMSINKFNEIFIGCLANYQKPGQSYFTLILDNNGQTINSQNISLSIRNFYSAYCSVSTVDNSFILSGSGPRISNLFSLWLLKVNRFGYVEWSKLYTPRFAPEPNYGAFGVSIEALENDRYMVMGRYGDDLRGANLFPNEMAGLMVEINGSGDIVSSNKLQFSSPAHCNPVDILYKNGNYYLIGSESYTHLGKGLFIAKYDSDRNIDFAKYLPGNLRYPRIEIYSDKLLLTGYTTIQNKNFQYFNKTDINHFDLCNGQAVSAHFTPIQLTEMDHSFTFTSTVSQADVIFEPIQSPCLMINKFICKRENNINFQQINYSRYFENDTALFFCQGTPIFFNGKYYSKAGIYYDTTQYSSNVCDTIHKISISEILSDSTKLEYLLCIGDTLTIGGKSFTKPDLYYLSDVNKFGCDSIIVLDLKQRDFNYLQQNFTICQGDSIEINGVFYKNSTRFVDTISSIDHCDTIVNNNIQMLPYGQRIINLDLCQGDSVTIGNKTYYNSGHFIDTLSTNGFCDTIYHINIFELSIDTTNQDYNICIGDTIVVDNFKFFTEGNYKIGLQNIHGCDSLIFLKIYINDYYFDQRSYSICLGDSILLNGTYYKEETQFKDTLLSFETCDTIVEYRIHLLTYGQRQQTIQLCPGDTFYIGENKYFQSGIYTDTISTPENCDSIIYTQILQLEESNTLLDFSICDNDSILIDKRYYSSEGTHTLHYTNHFGCDSIVKILIHRHRSSSNVIDTFICEEENIKIGNSIISQSGIYFIELKNQYNCDSLIEARVMSKDCYQIYIPNAFSPNQDGVNDECKIYHNGVSNLNIEIYDRWGGMVFKSNSVSGTWDGNSQGKDCMVGVYA
ncbi:MAG: gliding motility-associated C-terminal domain-containing protein [Saprospiraceae bacterium]|nr:gliding motility-associated C-terminal domain-containing protein [Saprospiraceae bacterium]